MTKIGIFIFRRDLRVYDNLALHTLLDTVDYIIPIFILDSYQIKKSSHNESYFSNNVVQFMCESLIDLDKTLKLQLFYGDYKDIIRDIVDIALKNFDKDKIVIGFNEDFSTYAIKRDTYIKDICVKNGIQCLTNKDDLTLIDIDKLVENKGSAYKQYGAYYKTAIKLDVHKPLQQKKINEYKNIFTNKSKYIYDIKDLHTFYTFNKDLAENGGRIIALTILQKHIKEFADYNDKRDLLSYKTTHLSAHLNFGTISIRELYYTILTHIGKDSQLIKQLYWRDYLLQAFKYFDHAKEYNRHMNLDATNDYDHGIKWKNEKMKKEWELLMSSKTGFLIIDAAMCQMITTGYMHNRARMIVGMFWTKYLLINPFDIKYGSQTGFSRYLVDAIGSTQNKMNHHMITEYDYPGKKYSAKGVPMSGRPMNIANEMIKKFDPDCEYIKTWLPHLKDIPNKDLYKWSKEISEKYNSIHPPPIFDSKEKYAEWIEAASVSP